MIIMDYNHYNEQHNKKSKQYAYLSQKVYDLYMKEAKSISF